MARAGEWCPEHKNGYDDCSFLHASPPPPHPTIRFQLPRAGIQVNGGKAHVLEPGLKVKTRCGIRVTVVDTTVHLDDVDLLPPEGRCAKCFPGTGRAGTAST